MAVTRQKKLTHKNEEKFTHRINFWLSKEDMETLNEIYVKHRTPTTDLLRGLLGEVTAFYRKNGYFTMPASVEPRKLGK